MGTSKRVVLLGAGHAHLYALKRAREFSRRGYELVVVAPDAFWYSGLATGVLGGNYAPEVDRVDIGALVARGGGRFRLRRRSEPLPISNHGGEIDHGSISDRPVLYPSLRPAG